LGALYGACLSSERVLCPSLSPIIAGLFPLLAVRGQDSFGESLSHPMGQLLDDL